MVTIILAFYFKITQGFFFCVCMRVCICLRVLVLPRPKRGATLKRDMSLPQRFLYFLYLLFVCLWLLHLSPKQYNVIDPYLSIYLSIYLFIYVRRDGRGGQERGGIFSNALGNSSISRLHDGFPDQATLVLFPFFLSFVLSSYNTHARHAPLV